MVNADPVPTSARVHRLRDRLIKLQKASGLTIPEICAEMGRPGRPINQSTYHRWMTPAGVANMPWDRVAGLCRVYGADTATTDQLVALAQDSEQLLGWLETYGGAPTPYLGTFLGFEALATRIEGYQNAVVTGLFQTPTYARAIIATGLPRLDTDEVDRRVRIRADRQKSVLERAAPPQIWAVITEGVLRHRIIDREAMKAQLAHLAALSERPTITLQIHGFECSATPATGGSPIMLFALQEQDEDIVYLELSSRGLFIEGDGVAQHAEILNHVRASALSPNDSQTRLAAITRDL